MNKLILLLCVFSVGCVTSEHRKSASLKNPSAKGNKKDIRKDVRIDVKKNAAPSASIAKQSVEAKQDEKDRNLVLKRKTEMQGLHVQARPQTIGNAASVLPSSPLKVAANLSERELFSEMFNRFEKNDDLGFKLHLDQFMKKFPASSRADEALYMAGLMAVSAHNYGGALRYFNIVLQKYPFSNKTSASLFAKGATFKKMNLGSISKDIFEQVIARYPGSPDADRAQIELRLLK